MTKKSRATSAEARLRLTQELNRRIIEAMPGGIVQVSADGAIQDANAEALRVLGFSFDELTQRYTSDFDTETLREDGTRCPVEDYPVTRALVTGVTQPPMTIGIKRPDGQVVWAVFTAVPLQDPETGSTTGAVVTFLDITERKQAEFALRKSEAELRSLLDNAPSYILTTDLDGTIRYINRSPFPDLAPSDLIGHRLSALLDDSQEQALTAALAFVAESGRATGLEATGASHLHRDEISEGARHLHRDEISEGASHLSPRATGASHLLEGEGSQRASHLSSGEEASGVGPRHYSIRLGPVTYGNGVEGITALLLDISERKRLQARLMQADRLASVGTLAAGVAHEINNPLAYVMANLELAGNELRRGSPDVYRLGQRFAAAMEGADRIRGIVRDLSTFSRSDTQDEAIVELHRVIDSSIRMAHNEWRYRARVTRSYMDRPVHVRGSASRLGQVFLNLLINAAHAIDEGDVESNEIEVATSARKDGSVLVQVTDTGRGMPPALQHRIFEPFVTTKPVGVGTGLGLYICHNIVTALGGNLRCESVPGHGTTFRVSLPEAKTNTASPPVRAAMQERVPPTRERILVVDDEPQIRSLLKNILAGHDVQLASSGREAIAALDQGSFAAILCDLVMPDLTGMDVYEHVRRTRPGEETKMVFVTGGAFTPRARQFVDHLPDRVLEKPFRPSEVLALLERVLSGEERRT